MLFEMCCENDVNKFEKRARTKQKSFVTSAAEFLNKL